ncbi:Uncharacterized protein SCF082_LOCUS11230 [Durusdinium trenchii]|uniref:Uncharacterized protein n=1 Tax=Durusdinium trenchii TaxID=1381693 RepID=A0ABP0JBS3_9DINO
MAASDENVEEPMAQPKANLPTCYFLATSAKCTKGYEGEYQWVIELEKGWSPWFPGNEPYYGETDAPVKYTLGRYDFEVHFESDTQGTQTNLTTGKVRRVQKLQKGEPMPAWEGTGIRRRPATGAGGAPPSGGLNSAPATSAAKQAQANREQRRGGYDANKAVQPHALRPQVSQSAYQASPVAAAPVKPKATALSVALSTAELSTLVGTRISLDSLVNCPAIRDYRSLSRPDTPHWIVTLSPISMHLDAEVGELLKPFGVRKMTRVSAQEINFAVSSKKIARCFRALNGVLTIGGRELEVTIRKAVSAERVEPAVGGLQAHQPMIAKDNAKSSMSQFRSEGIPQEKIDSAEEMGANAKSWIEGLPQEEDTSTEEIAVSEKSSMSQFRSEGMPQEKIDSAEEMAANAKSWIEGLPQEEDTSTEEIAVSEKSSMSQFRSEGMPQEKIDGAEEMAANAKSWIEGLPQEGDTSTEEIEVSEMSSMSQFRFEGMPQEETSREEMAKSLLWQLLSEGMGRR